MIDHGVRRAVGTAVVGVLLVAGCTAGGGEEQRVAVLDTAAGVEAALVEQEGWAADVVDDGSQPTPCPAGGERYRRLVVGVVEPGTVPEGRDAVDEAAKDALTTVRGALQAAPDPDRFDQGASVPSDAEVPRQQLWWADDGAWLTLDLTPGLDGSLQLRLETSTACA